MASNKIRIEGDFSGLIRGFSKATKEFKKLDKLSIKIDDKDMKSFKKFNIETWRDLQKDVDKYQAKLEKLNKIKLNDKLTNNQLQQEKQINALIEKRTRELEKQKNHVKEGNFLQRRGARMQGNSAPGSLGDVVGGAMGGMGNAISAMGPLGMVAGAGFGMYMGARALTGPRRALADQNLRFMGMNRGAVGKGQLENLRQAGIESGYTATESMDAANNLQRNVGNVRGREDLQSLFTTSRQTGMGADEIAQLAGTFRSSAIDQKGTNLQENLKKTQDLYKQSMISALDSSGAIKFLQTTAEMTDQIANEGSADTESIRNALSSLALQNDFFKANSSRGEAAFKGAEGFYKSGQGTGLAMRSMMSAGFGQGKGPMEMLLAQKMGFTSGNPGSEFGGIGAKGLTEVTKQLAGASAGLTPENYGKSSKESRAGAINAISEQFGIRPENAEQLLKTSMTGGQMDDASIKKMFETDDQKMVSLQSSMDMTIKKNEAHLQEIMMDVGDILAPAVVNIENMLYKLVDHITGNAGSKSERILDLEAKDAMNTANEKRGTFLDSARKMFTGGSADSDANMAFEKLAREKVAKGKGLNFNESNSFVQNANVEGLMSMSDSALSGSTESWRKSRYDQLVATRDILQKSVSGQMEGYDQLDESGKKKISGQVTDENNAVSELTSAIDRLTKFLGDRPVKSMKDSR